MRAAAMRTRPRGGGEDLTDRHRGALVGWCTPSGRCSPCSQCVARACRPDGRSHRVRQSDRRRWSGGFGILMTPRDLLTLITLAALWGASFLFIKLAVEDVPPLGVVEMRLLLGAATV